MRRANFSALSLLVSSVFIIIFLFHISYATPSIPVYHYLGEIFSANDEPIAIAAGTKINSSFIQIVDHLNMNNYNLTNAYGVHASALCLGTDCITSWSQVEGQQLWKKSGNNIYYDAGNVGIKISSPALPLDVAGAARFNGSSIVVASSSVEGGQIVLRMGATIMLRGSPHQPGI
jgi:hypothetical protein